MSTFSVISILTKVIVILGCLLFVFSFIYPFYQVISGTYGGGTASQLWSFKSDSQTWVGAMLPSKEPFRSQSWFFDYWLSSSSWWSLSEIGISWILPLLFTVQVLTLVLGVASVIFNRRILSFTPVLLSLAVILLAIYLNWIVNPTGEIKVFHIGGGEILFATGSYQLGYYLVYPSIAMFMLAFALNEVIRKSYSKIPRNQKTLQRFL